MRTTTDLAEIRKYPKLFTWGRVTEIIDISSFYTIVCFTPTGTTNRAFHVYVDGKDTSRSAASLEGAMVIAIACGSFESKNEADHMGRAACKLLDIDTTNG